MRKHIGQILFAVMTFSVLVLYAENEISVTPQISVVNGIFELEQKSGSIDIDQDNIGASDVIMNVGTGTHELVTIAADIATNGWAWFRNVSTNEDRYVELGPEGASTNFIAVIRLETSEVCLTRLHPTNALYTKATGGAVNLRAIIIQD